VKTLLTAEQIATRVGELADEITQAYRGRVPVLVGVLKGSVYFLADLVRRLRCDHEVDFISVSSYGDSTETSGVVRLLKDLDLDVTGRDVLLVEDIVDTGMSLDYIRRNLLSREPRSFAICALLDKPARRVVEVAVDYVGFTIPNAFVVGYGLDYAERFRHLPYVAVTEPGDLEPET
jgi:hypoxanthine phosphoribosyltransferase